MTPGGKQLYEQLSELQIHWAEEKSTGIGLKEMQATLETLQLLVKRFKA